MPFKKKTIGNEKRNEMLSLVTGASRGIGAEIASQLAHKNHRVLLGCRDVAAGAKVVAAITASLRREQEQRRATAGAGAGDGVDAAAALAQRLSVVQLDVTTAASIAAAAETIAQRYGAIDCLINNAGFALEDDATNIDIDQAKRIFDTNFWGTIAVTQGMLPLLRKSTLGGRIVNVSSIMASLAEHSDPNSTFIQNTKTVAYSASKSALNMYTVQLARELRREGIRVNAVHPGWIKTEMGEILGSPPSDVQFGAKQIVDMVGSAKSRGGPTGGFFHNKLQLRW